MMLQIRCAHSRGIARRSSLLLQIDRSLGRRSSKAPLRCLSISNNALSQASSPQLPMFVQSSWIQYKDLINVKQKAKIDHSYINKMRIEQRLNDRPSIGSLVEFKKAGKVRIGVIVSDDRLFFNANKYEVFTAVADSEAINSLDTITPDDIRFHLGDFIRPERLFCSLEDTDDLNNRVKLNKVLKDFIHVSFEAIQRHHQLIPMIQAYFSKSFTPLQLNLSEVAKLMRSKTPNPDRSPGVEYFMFGLHLHFQSDPWNFTVIDQNDYILNDLQSSTVPKGLTYFSNSVYEAELLDYASTLGEESQLLFNLQLKDFLAKSEESVLYEFLENPNDKRFIELKSYIMVLRQHLRHPHPEMYKVLEAILKDILDDITPQNIFALLRKLYVFPSNYTQLQHPHITLPNTLMVDTDHFKHLRKKHDLISYGLPSLKHIKLFGNDADSEIAVSLDHSNLKHWKLNIHIPDVGSVLRPNDPLVGQILDKGSDVELPLNQIETLFDEQTLRGLSFKESGVNRAITLTIDYKVEQNNRWYTSKAKLSLTELHNFKKIPMPELNEVWKLRSPNISNFFEMLMSFPLRGNKFKKLSKSDRETLDHIFTMVDYWFFKRGEKGSMEYQIPRTKLTQSDDHRRIITQKQNMEKFSYLEYLLKELDLITSEHLHQYAKSSSLALITHDQSLVTGSDKVNDSIEITSPQFTVPDYTTSKFEELVYPKDSNGFTPLQNYITAIQFLKPSTLTTTSSDSRYASLGLADGYINFTRPLDGIEGILNQWQVVSHLQQELVSSLLGDQDKYEKYDLQQLYPKDYSVLTTEELSQYYSMKVDPLRNYQRYLLLSQDRYLRLRQIEDGFKRQQDELLLNWDIYRCVILKPITDGLTKAWCFEFGLQVDVIFDNLLANSYQVGDQIICNEIVSVDPVGSKITLKA